MTKTNGKSAKSLTVGTRVRLLREFKNGANQVFPAGTTGTLKSNPLYEPYLYLVHLDGFKCDIRPLRIHVEKLEQVPA